MEKSSARRVLVRNRWFAGVPGTLASEILRLGEIRHVKDRPLFSIGDEASGLFAVLSGQVRISHAAPDGQIALLFVVKPGSWFGETSLLDDGCRNSEALAVGPVELLHLSKTHFRRLTNDNMRCYAAFVRLLCEHHRLAMDHLASLGALPSSARLAQRLLFLAASQEGAETRSIVIHLSQAELASAVGISRQALNSQLKKLEGLGVISLGYRTIEIRKRQILQRMLQRTLGRQSEWSS